MVIFARFEIVSSIGVGAVLWSLAEGCRADPSCLLPHIALTAERLVYLPGGLAFCWAPQLCRFWKLFPQGLSHYIVTRRISKVMSPIFLVYGA